MGQIQQAINQTINTAAVGAGAYKKIVEPALAEKAQAEKTAKTQAEINAISLTNEQKKLAHEKNMTFDEYKEELYYSQPENRPERVKQFEREGFEVEEIKRQEYEDALKRGLINTEKSEEKMNIANSGVSPQLQQQKLQKKSFNRLKDAKKRRAGGIKF